jgi:hypothetical protein
MGKKLRPLMSYPSCLMGIPPWGGVLTLGVRFKTTKLREEDIVYA